jgi:hypothetical protein
MQQIALWPPLAPNLPDVTSVLGRGLDNDETCCALHSNLRSEDSQSCSTLMCPVVFTGSLSRPCFSCGLRLLFNSPPAGRVQPVHAGLSIGAEPRRSVGPRRRRSRSRLASRR